MEEGHAFGVSIEAAVLPMDSVVSRWGHIRAPYCFRSRGKNGIGLSSRIEEPTVSPCSAWPHVWSPCWLGHGSRVGNAMLALSGELGWQEPKTNPACEFACTLPRSRKVPIFISEFQNVSAHSITSSNATCPRLLFQAISNLSALSPIAVKTSNNPLGT